MHDAPAIVKNLNENKTEDLRRLCKVFLGDPNLKLCTMSALDPLGLNMLVKDSDVLCREYRVSIEEVVPNRFHDQPDAEARVANRPPHSFS